MRAGWVAWAVRAVWTLLFLGLSLPALAHDISWNKAEVRPGPDTLRMTLRLGQEDLLSALGLPGKTFAGPDQIDSLLPKLEAYLASRIRIEGNGRRLGPGRLQGWKTHSSKASQEPEKAARVDTSEAVPLLLSWEMPMAPGIRTLTFRFDLFEASVIPVRWAVLVFPEGAAKIRHPKLAERGDEITYDLSVPGWKDGSRRTGLGGMFSPGGDSFSSVIGRFVGLGFTHILPLGLDHILFILGLFFLSPRIRPLLAQVTAFTAAHTLTLAITMLGVLSFPARVVEPLIALSITAVAVENLFFREIKPWRWAVVFAFGLIHGMGFAGVLSDLGLPEESFLTALLSFNVGVELGQFAVLIVAGLLTLAFRNRAGYRRYVSVPASLAIAATGLYWAAERIGLLG